ncbi:MAG: hypothetical protein PHR53_04930 [Bacteroidales bacterium]|nr:hypothetical protein [Bacteroidales bacterium]
MKLIFFNNPKPKQFQYKPRFYNAQKEVLEQRIKEHELSQEQSEGERIRMKMHTDWERQRVKRETKHKTWRSLLILIALAAMIFYIMFR